MKPTDSHTEAALSPQPPTYGTPPAKVHEPFLRRAFSGAGFDNLFFVIANVCVLLLAIVLFRQGLRWSANLVYLVLFWLVLTYLALPRLHRVLTSIYVPDYFIGRTHTTDGLLGDPVNLALQGDAARSTTRCNRPVGLSPTRSPSVQPGESSSRP